MGGIDPDESTQIFQHRMISFTYTKDLFDAHLKRTIVQMSQKYREVHRIFKANRGEYYLF
jgi:hypothetical protein